MKQHNLLTILIVLFIVLAGVWYVRSHQQQREVRIIDQLPKDSQVSDSDTVNDQLSHETKTLTIEDFDTVENLGRTALMIEKDLPPIVVSTTFQLKESPSSFDTIIVGGLTADGKLVESCNQIPSAQHCGYIKVGRNSQSPVYTNSQNPEVVAFFESYIDYQ
ncbi:hypothetical protein KC901_03465 [Patescibacteria group bacterium]|nr:hypothetical protein [Patescibacteria group bacterium]